MGGHCSPVVSYLATVTERVGGMSHHTLIDSPEWSTHVPQLHLHFTVLRSAWHMETDDDREHYLASQSDGASNKGRDVMDQWGMDGGYSTILQ